MSQVLNLLGSSVGSIIDYIPFTISSTIAGIIAGAVISRGWRFIKGVKDKFNYFNINDYLYSEKDIIYHCKNVIPLEKAAYTFYIDEDNLIIVEAIIHFFSKKNVIKGHVDFVNKVINKSSTKEDNIKSQILKFPLKQFAWDGMKFRVYKYSRNWSNYKEESKTIHIWSNDRKQINNFIEQCKEEYLTVCYPAPISTIQSLWNIENKDNITFERYDWHCSKTFDNVFIEDKRILLKCLDHFLNKSGPWLDKGRANMFRLFLHGPPGTGKTSIVKAIANKTKRHLINIKLSEIKSDRDLFNIMCRQYVVFKGDDTKYQRDILPLDKRIYVFDDIDRDDTRHIIAPADLDDNKEQPPDSVTQSGFLNILDGQYEIGGAIIIINTNYLNRFDPTVYRNGRADLCLKLDVITYPTIIEFMRSYYNNPSLKINIKKHIMILPNRLEYLCQCFSFSEVVEKLNKGDF